MDNSAQSSTQPVQITQPVQPAAQPVVPEVPAIQVPSSPVSPISSPHPEAGPVSTRVTEYIRPTEAAPVLAPEVKAAGVEISPNTEQPQIPADVAQAGVQLAKAAVPVSAATGNAVEYITNAPFTQAEAVQYEKSKSASDSLRWLATFVLRQIKKLNVLGH